jgi:aminoglycoside phosphotransferase (APT) family kinase protein
MTRASEAPPGGTDDLAALSTALGEVVIDTMPVPWGDAHATWELLTPSRTLVARRFGDPQAARRSAGIMRAVGDSGVPVPSAWVVDAGGVAWLVMDRVDGDNGSIWLDDPIRARALATSMGALWRSLQQVVISTIDANDALSSAGSAPGRLVHGDFAPVNVVVGPDATIRALLDFEHAHEGDPLEDVAWWGWVVRHHHPDAWAAAWLTFCAAAGVDPTMHAPTLRRLMLDRLDRRAQAAADDPTRHRWLTLREEAAAWSVS